MVNLLIPVCSFYVLYLIHKNIFKENVLDIFNGKIDVNKCAIYSLSFSLGFSILVLILDIVGFINIINEYTNINLNLILGFLNSIFIIPIVEEYLFRYLPIRIFKNKNLVIFISSLIFSLVHSTFGIMYLVIFLSSLLLFYIYKKTNNIKYSIISHSMYNLLIILFSLLKLI